VAVKAKATWLVIVQARRVRRMAGVISSSDDDGGSDDDVPPATDTYTEGYVAPRTTRARGQCGSVDVPVPLPVYV
jgi:hypothetical protein